MKKQLLIIMLSFFAIGFIAWQNRFKLTEDILKELGLEKEMAEDFISGNFFNGSIQIYKTDQMLAMSQTKRATLVKPIGDYIKAYVASPAFATKFEEERKSFLGLDLVEAAPSREELIEQFLQQLKTDESEIVQAIKTASSSQKTELEKALKQVREAQVALKDPKHPLHKKYFDLMKEEMIIDNTVVRYEDPAEAKAAEEAMKGIELETFPSTPQELIKKRLKEFIDISGSVDFNAKLEKRGSISYFVDPRYEQKDHTWKLIFRCGKEVILPARAYAQQWLALLPK